MPPTRILDTFSRTSPTSKPFLNQQVSPSINERKNIGEKRISISDMVKYGLQNEVSTKELIDRYFDKYIEYTDTSLYKSICGQENLLRKFEEESNKKLLFSCDDNSKVSLIDMMISFDEINHNKAKVFLLYDGHRDPDSTTKNEEDTNHNYHVEHSILGMTVMNIENDKITTLFNVKRALDCDFMCLKGESHEEVTNTILDDNEEKYLMHSSDDKVERAKMVITEFFDARNNFDLQKFMNFMASDCTLECVSANNEVGRLRKDYLSLSTYFQKLTSSSPPSSPSFIIDDIFVSTTNPCQNEVKIGVEWHIEVNGEITRFQRGCSLYTVNVNNLFITRGIDIMESTKEENSDAEKVRNILNPWWQNRLRDSGIGRFVADSLVKFSLPAIVSDDSTILSNFLALNKIKKELSYGKHKSQTMDLFFPDNRNKIKGVAFFMVRLVPRFFWFQKEFFLSSCTMLFLFSMVGHGVLARDGCIGILL